MSKISHGLLAAGVVAVSLSILAVTTIEVAAKNNRSVANAANTNHSRTTNRNPPTVPRRPVTTAQ
jgi:hypothetical protein